MKEHFPTYFVTAFSLIHLHCYIFLGRSIIFTPCQCSSSTIFCFTQSFFILEHLNFKFDRVDLICVAISSVMGLWYLVKKVSVESFQSRSV